MSSASPKLPPVAIVVSVYNATVTTRLREGAIAEYVRRGGEREAILLYEVRGAFEIPVVAEAAAHRFVHDHGLCGVVCLGCIIKGDTRHDEVLGDVVTEQLSRIAVRHRIPIGLGVLTVNDAGQAEARAGGDKGNKGQEAMAAALDAWGALEAIRTSTRSFKVGGPAPDKLKH
jgi:6,7-dimethyl-8-ribityllumazine synthase